MQSHNADTSFLVFGKSIVNWSLSLNDSPCPGILNVLDFEVIKFRHCPAGLVAMLSSGQWASGRKVAEF